MAFDTRETTIPALSGPVVRAAITRATSSHRRACGWLLAICLLSFIPGFFWIPPVDRDEARFAQATKQMIETGDYVDIRFQEQTRYKKPVGIYWLQAAVVKTAEALNLPRARTRIFLYRIPSLIGAIGAVLMTYWAALAFVSRRAATLAGIMMATSLLLSVEARLATTDAMLLLTVVAAMGAFGRVYLAGYGERMASKQTWSVPAIFWIAIAAGILLKGPAILMFVVLTGAVLVATDRSAPWIGRLRPLPGLALVLLLVLPWFLAIVLRSGESFFAESLGHDLFEKVTSGQERHGAPPGAYLLMFWVTFLPGAMLAPVAAPAIWRDRSEPGAKFLLAWLVPAWIVFEIVATKLPHYVLPVYPAIAILIAGVIDGHVLSKNRWLMRAPMWWFVLTLAGAIGVVTLHFVIGQRLGVLSWPFAAAAIIFAMFAWWLYRADGAELSLLRAATASLLLSAALFGATLPSIPRLFPSVDLGKFVYSSPCNDPVVVTAGYHEPSLVFLTGTGLQHTTAAQAAEVLNGGPCRFAFIEGRQERSFVQRADAIGLRYYLGRRVEGYNVTDGLAINVAIFHSELPR